MQPHMVIYGSFYHCASLTNRDMWRIVEGISEILPIPQVITELLNKWERTLPPKDKRKSTGHRTHDLPVLGVTRYNSVHRPKPAGFDRTVSDTSAWL